MQPEIEQIFAHPAVAGVIFHPRPETAAADTHDLLLPGADNVRLGARLHSAGTTAPLILCFHGNGEIASDYDMIAPCYQRIGLSLLVVDYRGYGRSTGQPTVAGLLADADALYAALPDVLQQQGLNPGKRFVMGRSLGSAPAIHIAAGMPPDLNGLIIESGFAYPLELIHRLGGPDLSAYPACAGAFGSLAAITRVTLPLLIIHGEADMMIPIRDAEALLAHAGSPNKTLLRIPGGNHNDLMMVGLQAYFAAIDTFARSA